MTETILSLSGILPFLVSIILVVASILDFVYFRLPNNLFLTIFYLFPLYILLTLNFYLVSNYLVFIIAMIVGFGLFAFSILGGGDAKLLAAVSLWVGADHILPFLGWMLLMGTFVSVLYLIASKPIGLFTANLRNYIQNQPFLKKIVTYFVPDIDSIEKEFTLLEQMRMIPYGIAISGAGLLVILKRMV